MVSRLNFVCHICCIMTTLLPLTSAQHGTPSPSNSHGGTPPSSSSSTTGGSSGYTQTLPFQKSAHILIIHAILGTLAWSLFAPLGAILLRLNIPGVRLLQFHVATQLLVYAMTIATTGLGIWLAIGASKYGNKWMDSHVIIGLVIFSVGTIQPWLGWIHHVIFKRSLIKYKQGVAMKRPGRTTIARLHIWIGRALILLGVINGGLGLRLAAGTPYQTASTTRKAEIAYGVAAGLMFLLFAGVSILFEYRRAVRIRSQREGQERPAHSRGQSVMAHNRSNSRSIPFLPASSEYSMASDEKGSETGR